ncbi:MAG: hypothetical protein S4CHLAM2_11220 [Chlamydiales bacterium]|nr:hypothetical protein [Chlamydiales bacterium]
MYKKQLSVFALILVAASLFVGLMIFRVTDEDVVAYQKLVESSKPVSKTVLSQSKQLREGVIKEIWYQGRSPLCIRIASTLSELCFSQQNGEMEVVEQLENVECLMQEKLYYAEGKPMQLVRYMEATRATYHYTTQIFTAEGTQFWRYRLEGHEPVSTIEGHEPIMSATAQTVEFTLKEKEIDFQAHQLRATFNQEEVL